MAFVHDRFLLVVMMRDSGGEVTKKTYQLRGADMAAASANAIAFVPVLAAASNAGVDGYHIIEAYRNDTPATFADDTVKNSVQAVISVVLASSPLKRATIVVPAPKNALFTAVSGEGSDVILNNASLVTGLVDEFKATGDVFISDGEDVAPAPQISGYRRSTSRKLA